MAPSRMKAKGRRDQPHMGRFAALPHAIFDTPEYASLEFRARALLTEFALQFNGSNNGYLTATYGRLRTRGFTSKDQLQKALRELINTGWVVVTRQGGRNYPSLYALTYRGVDYGEFSLDVRPGPPINAWRSAGHAPSEAPLAHGGPIPRLANNIPPRCAPTSGPELARTGS